MDPSSFLAVVALGLAIWASTTPVIDKCTYRSFKFGAFKIIVVLLFFSCSDENITRPMNQLVYQMSREHTSFNEYRPLLSLTKR